MCFELAVVVLRPGTTRYVHMSVDFCLVLMPGPHLFHPTALNTISPVVWPIASHPTLAPQHLSFMYPNPCPHKATRIFSVGRRMCVLPSLLVQVIPAHR